MKIKPLLIVNIFLFFCSFNKSSSQGYQYAIVDGNISDNIGNVQFGKDQESFSGFEFSGIVQINSTNSVSSNNGNYVIIHRDSCGNFLNFLQLAKPVKWLVDKNSDTYVLNVSGWQQNGDYYKIDYYNSVFSALWQKYIVLNPCHIYAQNIYLSEEPFSEGVYITGCTTDVTGGFGNLGVTNSPTTPSTNLATSFSTNLWHGSSNGFFVKIDRNGNYKFHSFLEGNISAPSYYLNQSAIWTMSSINFGGINTKTFLWGYYAGDLNMFSPPLLNSCTIPGPGCNNQSKYVGNFSDYGNNFSGSWSKNFNNFPLLGTTETDLEFKKSGQNVIVAGSFAGSTNLNFTGNGINNIVNSQAADIFITSITNGGLYNWSKTIGGLGNDRKKCMTTDQNGNIYILGTSDNQINFDPSGTNYTVNFTGNDNYFLLKLSSGGNFIWVKQLNISGEYNKCFVYDNGNSIYLSGTLQGSADFNPDPNQVDIKTSFGLNDNFFVKLSNTNCNEPCPLCTIQPTVTKPNNVGDVTLTTAGITLVCNRTYDFNLATLTCNPVNSAIVINEIKVIDGLGNTPLWASIFSGTGMLSIPANTVGLFYLKYVWGTSTLKCDSVSYPINVICQPPCNITGSVGEDKQICIGRNISISPTYITASNTTFSWTSNPAGFLATQKNISVAPIVTTTYFLTVTNSVTQCVVKDTITITVNDCPIVTNNQDTTAITNLCSNADFENGQQLLWSDWHAGYGNIQGNSVSLDILSSNYTFSWGIKNTGVTSTEIENQTNACSDYLSCNAAIGISSADYLQFNQNHHIVVGSGNDPIVPSLSKTHNNSAYSLKLGNSASNNGFEFVEKKFVVTAANANFSFWYAFVMSNPEHGNGEDQYFGVDVFKATGSTISKITNVPATGVNVNVGTGLSYAYSSDLFSQTYARNRFCSPAQTLAGGIKYKNWSYVNIDLSNQIGNTIVIRIWTRDCSHCGDFAYAYLDDFCSQVDNTNPTGSVSIANQSNCGLNGNVCVNYTLPNNGTTTGTAIITMPIYQNGNAIPVYTLTSGILSSASPNPYCFNLNSVPSALFANGSSHFDYIIKSVFKINSTTVFNQSVGTEGTGITAGIDNDYQINCTPPCPCSAIDLATPKQSINNGAFQNYPGGTVIVPCGSRNKFYAMGIFASNCTGVSIVAELKDNNNIPVSPAGVGNDFMNPLIYTFSTTNNTNYTLIYTLKINGTVCKTLSIPIVTNCAAAPVNCSICTTSVSNSSIVSLTNSNNGTSQLTQSFHFNNLPATITEVRAMLTDIKIWAEDATGTKVDECLSCISNPIAWGSIVNGVGISGANPKININGNNVNAPVTLQQDQNPRNITWSGGNALQLISNIKLDILLPQASTLSCCTRKATICVKFVFRDNECNECIVRKCFDVAIK